MFFFFCITTNALVKTHWFDSRFEASINRSLRAHQDEAFMESLRADQEKERRREEQRLAAEAEQRRLREAWTLK